MYNEVVEISTTTLTGLVTVIQVIAQPTERLYDRLTVHNVKAEASAADSSDWTQCVCLIHTCDDKL